MASDDSANCDYSKEFKVLELLLYFSGSCSITENTCN